jgi:hypothetical protein
MYRTTSMMILTIAVLTVCACNASPDKSSPTQGSASQSSGTAQQPGKMYYTVSGSTITIHNTPNGVMKEEMDLPPGASGGSKSLYILDEKGNITKDTIDIEYDRGGIKSVTMKGAPIPRQQ